MIDESKLKEVLGDDEFKAYQEFAAKRADKALRGKATDLANSMIGEGGKYHKDFSRASAQADAIWDRAFSEAAAQVGLVIEAKK